MKKYLKYGPYVLGVGIMLAIAGSITGKNLLIGPGVILAFGGFIAWRKDVKQKEDKLRDAIHESVQYGQKWKER